MFSFYPYSYTDTVLSCGLFHFFSYLNAIFNTKIQQTRTNTQENASQRATQKRGTSVSDL